MPNFSEFWMNILQMITNSAVIFGVFKVTRHMSRMEFKVDMMWEFFNVKLERRGSTFVEKSRNHSRD